MALLTYLPISCGLTQNIIDYLPIIMLMKIHKWMTSNSGRWHTHAHTNTQLSLSLSLSQIFENNSTETLKK